MLKPIASSVAQSLCLLFNKSIRLCSLPHDWKLTNIVPIPKSNSSSNVSNYRPISLLSVISKICEKYISFIILDHPEANHILSDSQWGFWEGRSTCGALLDLTHMWQLHLNRGHDVIVVFFYYAKAFDSIPHSYLLSTLEQIRLHSHIIQWLKAYLTNRRRRVQVNGVLSDSVHIVSGVPQGSILGLILFTYTSMISPP